jgi:hypothetical protein
MIGPRLLRSYQGTAVETVVLKASMDVPVVMLFNCRRLRDSEGFEAKLDAPAILGMEDTPEAEVQYVSHRLVLTRHTL